MPKGIYKHKPHSEIACKNMSDAKKGKMPKFIPNNKGRIPTETARKNMSLAHKGKKPSKETRFKMGLARRGEKNNLWRGGKMNQYPENEKIRKSIEYRLWREAVFARDNWTCQKTGVKGGRLVVHHVQNFADFPELRTSIENGITLSKETHNEFHKTYGKKNNNREQLNNFLNI